MKNIPPRPSRLSISYTWYLRFEKGKSQSPMDDTLQYYSIALRLKLAGDLFNRCFCPRIVQSVGVQG